MNEGERFQRVFEDAAIGIALLAIEPLGKYLEVNPAFCRMTGYSRDELLARDFQSITASQDVGKNLEQLHALLTGTVPFLQLEKQYIRKNTSAFWTRLNVSLVRDDRGTSQYFIVQIEDIDKSKRAEEQIRKSEALLTEAQQVAHIGNWNWDIRTNVVTWSDELYRMFGLRPQEIPMTFERFLSYVHPEDRDEVKDVAQSALKNHQPFDHDRRIIWPDGTIRIQDSRGAVEVNAAGNPVRLYGTVQDITERRRAEEALRESEARLRAIIDHEPECVKLVDRNGNLLDMNPAGLRIIEADSLAQVEGLCIYPLVAEEYREAYRQLHERVLHGESGSLVFDIISLKGTRRTIETHETPLLDPSGTVFAALGITHDITERKRAEEALRESSQFNQQIIANAREGIIVYDRDLRYVVWNPFMEEMTGLGAEKMLGKRPRDLPTALQQEHGKILLTNQAAEEIETNLKRAMTGETFTYLDVPFVIAQTGMTGWASAQYSPFRNAQGEIVGAIAIIRDITERKRLEEQLQHAQKLEAVGQLAGGVAHEFNNMLTAIIGNLDMALGQIPPESDQHSTLTGALQAARRAAMLTQQLLTFSHRSPMDPQPQDLGSIASEIVNLLRQTIDRRIQVSVQAGDGLWPVLADAGQMHQVIMNLCVNARDSLVERMEKAASRPGPTGWEPQIAITIENVQIDEAYCKLHYDARPGEYVCLSISDNGCGIDEEVRHRIFEPFFTTKEVGRGTGLGLAAVYGIIKQHEGWIDLSSMKNMGTTFKSYLPRTRRPAIPIPQSVPGKGIAHGSETLLFVDDEASIRRLGQTILEHHGYTVLLAKNGEEALEVFQRERDRIKLVVLDLTMPRLSGREVLKRLLKIDPKIRVLISSGHHMADDSSELQNLGAVEFVPKPYRPDDLARSVRKLLDASASPQRQAS